MIRVGIAGIGYIAEEYIRLFTLGKISGGCITALSSRNAVHLQEIKARFSLEGVSLFSDYNAMLESGCIDMAIICTPHFYHPDMAIRAISRGIHTLIEKPVGVFPEDLDALTACIQAHPHIQAGVLYCRRANPVFQKIKELLGRGILGQLKRVTWIITDMYRPQCYFDCVDWRGTYSGEGGGLLMNQVSHHIDLLTWFCGLPDAMQAHCYTARERAIEVENEVSITMEYPGNALGQFIASSRECPGTNRLEFSGSKGQLILDREQTLTLRILDTDESVFSRTCTKPFGTIPYQEQVFSCDAIENTVIQAKIIQNFLDALSGKEPVLCPVADAVRAQQFIQSACLSSWQGRKLTLPSDGSAYSAELKKRILHSSMIP